MVLHLLERYPSPERLAAVTERQLAKRLLKLAPRIGATLANEIVQALSEQSVMVHGTKAAAGVLPSLARQLLTLQRRRESLAQEVERLVQAHALFAVLTSMPGVGLRTAARLLTEVTCRAFAPAAHLAAYAGLAPVTRRSGSSVAMPRDGAFLLPTDWLTGIDNNIEAPRYMRALLPLNEGQHAANLL